MSCNCCNGLLPCRFCHIGSWLFICSIPVFLSRLNRVRAQFFSALGGRSWLLWPFVLAKESFVHLFGSELLVDGGKCLEGVWVKAKYSHAAEVVRACLYELKRISANHNSYQSSGQFAHGMCRRLMHAKKACFCCAASCVQHLINICTNSIHCCM